MYQARDTMERKSLRALEQHVRATGWVEHAADMLESFGGLELCLLRFLRARSLDVDQAAVALSATLAFRQTNTVSSAETIAAVHRDGIINWWCGIFAGVTSDGCPVTYWRFRCIDTDQLKLVNEKQLKRFYIAWMEHGLALQREAAAHRPTGCPGMVDIYDMEGVGWGQMSSGMRLLSGVLSVAQDHYPENLRKAFLVNVPGFFAGSWRLISAAIDKRTQQKIVISKDGGSEMLDTALGRAQEFGKTPSRASVWRTGDEWLGGGTDEVVHLSANSSWVHKQAVEVTSESGRVGGREIGQATYTDTGCRLFWYFHVEGPTPVDFGVTFTPATQGDFAQESQSDTNIQVYPTTSCTGRPVRGCLDGVRPGTYVLVWKCQPGRHARRHKLKRRCWLGAVDQEPFGNLFCAGHSDIRSENAFAQAIEPDSARKEAPSRSASSNEGVIGTGDVERRDRPEKSRVSLSACCSNDEDTNIDELSSRQPASSAIEVRVGDRCELQDVRHIYDCDSDGQRNVVHWCWSATLCAGVGVGSLLCARVLHSSATG